MISSQIIKKNIDELKMITKVDIWVTDLEGNIVCSTTEDENFNSRGIMLFIESEADSQVIQGFHFFKVLEEKQVEYILVSKGSSEDAYMIGRIAVSQIQQLIIAYRERYDKNDFIQNLLLDNMLLVDIYNRAKKLHIDIEAKRVVFLIETKNEKDSMALETIKNMFSFQNGDFITAVEEKSIILVKEIEEEDSENEIMRIAKTIRDMVNSEAMASVRIAYGTTVNEISLVSKSYKEAKMASDVGKIFYADRDIVSYNMMGIGRLIYQLPLPLCDIFMKEVFTLEKPEDFDEETLTTIHKFFENNLNVSETARQLYVHRNTLVYRLEKLQKSTGLDIRTFEDALTFKIALMVSNYMKYMEKNEF